MGISFSDPAFISTEQTTSKTANTGIETSMASESKTNNLHLYIVLLIIILKCNVNAQTIINRPALGDCELTFEDNFDGNTINTAVWHYRTDSKHWSTQLPENVEVKNGFLYLNVKKQTVNNMNYTGAGVISKQAFKFGYYESRFKIPAGDGWHTSFWMMGFDGSGGTSTGNAYQEIDVCENDSKNFTKYATNVHNWLGTHTSVGGQNVTTPDLSNEFHTWACDFSPTEIRFYFEGDLVRTVDVSKQALNDNNIWLTTIGSYLGSTTAIDDTQLPSAAIFDYVRYYKQLNPVYPEYNPSDTSTVAPNPANTQIIIDNTDTACSFDAPWTQSSYNSGFYGTNYAHDGTATADPAKWAKWTPTIPTTGYYNIYMRWPAAANRAKAAPVEILHGEGTTTVTVDQTINNASWRYLGNFLLLAGTGNNVKISASSEGYTMADAVMFEQINVNTEVNQHESPSGNLRLLHQASKNDIRAAFTLSNPAQINLSVYNTSGIVVNRILEKESAPQYYELPIVSSTMKQGLYIVVLRHNGQIVDSKRFVLN